MDDILQKIPGESLRNPWRLEAPMLPTEQGERPDEGFLSDLESLFLVGTPNEVSATSRPKAKRRRRAR
jgi:hypothetical protein